MQRPKTEKQKPIFDILEKRAGLKTDEILQIGAPQFYYTSPGGIDERVESFLVKIAGWNKPPQAVENYTPFAGAGFVRELDALQVLRASHVGGMFDARLEINIYRLLRRLNLSAGAWIGASLNPKTQETNIKAAEILELSSAEIEAFEPVESNENNFLRLEKSEFVETDSTGREIARAEFEYVAPKNFSKNTVAAIPFFQTESGIFIGIEFRDLPAPQRFSGTSRLVCVPAWRLPLAVEHKFDLEAFLREKFPKDFRALVNKTWELGGSYFTSAGVTPEVVYPVAVELKAESLSATDLRFFHLKNLHESADKIQDAHLLILLNRLAHGLGFAAVN